MANEYTIDAMFDDGKAHEHTPKFKKGQRVLTLPGAGVGAYGVQDGAVYEITEVSYVGNGDFFYRMGHGSGNFVCEDEIELVESSERMGNHADDDNAQQIEVGDIVRALPGAGNFTVSVVDGEVYEVVRKNVGTFGSTFYHLGQPEGNGVYREEIELVSKGAK